MAVAVRDLVSQLVSSTTAPAFAVNDEQHFTCWNDAAAKLLLSLRSNFYDLPCYAVIKGRTVNGEPFCRPDC